MAERGLPDPRRRPPPQGAAMRKLALISGSMALAVAMLAAPGARAQLQAPGAVPQQYPGQPGGGAAAPAPTGGAAADLKESEKEDSGIGLGLLWVDGTVGGSYVDLKS